MRREKLIQIRVTKDEHDRILGNAKRLKMKKGPYIRMVAIDPKIVNFDYSIIAAHTKEIGEVRSSINRLIYTIEASNNYLPREIKSIVQMIAGIFESENKLLETLRKERLRQYKRDQRLVRKDLEKFYPNTNCP